MLICNICKKEYATQQSRSNHMKKFHLNESENVILITPNSTKTPPKSTEITPNSTEITPNSTKTPPKSTEITPKNKCIKCNKIYSRSDSLLRHVKLNRCKVDKYKEKEQFELDKMKEQYDELKRQNEEVKKQLLLFKKRLFYKLGIQQIKQQVVSFVE